MSVDEFQNKIWGVADIKKALGIGKNKIYDYMKMDSCPATKDGKCWAVYSDDFCDWYREMKKTKQI